MLDKLPILQYQYLVTFYLESSSCTDTRIQQPIYSATYHHQTITSANPNCGHFYQQQTSFPYQVQTSIQNNHYPRQPLNPSLSDTQWQTGGLVAHQPKYLAHNIQQSQLHFLPGLASHNFSGVGKSSIQTNHFTPFGLECTPQQNSWHPNPPFSHQEQLQSRKTFKPGQGHFVGMYNASQHYPPLDVDRSATSTKRPDMNDQHFPHNRHSTSAVGEQPAGKSQDVFMAPVDASRYKTQFGNHNQIGDFHNIGKYQTYDKRKCCLIIRAVPSQ